MTNSVLVGIGTQIEQLLPATVLKYSIIYCSSIECEFIFLNDVEASKISMLKTEKIKGRTPFSFQRFLLAYELLSSSKDIAIYLDSDMLVFSNIAGLVDEFNQLDFTLATVNINECWKRKPQSSVLVFNRIGAQNLIDRFQNYIMGKIDYDELLYFGEMDGWRSIQESWNSLEIFDVDTNLIHFTDMDTQPWLKSTNKFTGLWEACLIKCMNEEEVQNIFTVALASKHVRPSLVAIKTFPFRHYSTFKLTIKDFLWIPPHRYNKIKVQFLRFMIAPFYQILWHFKLFRKNGMINEP